MDKEFFNELSMMLDEKLNPINEKLGKIEKKVDSIFEETANLMEFKTEVKETLDEVVDSISLIETVTAKNWQTVASLRRDKEKNFKKQDN